MRARAHDKVSRGWPILCAFGKGWAFPILNLLRFCRYLFAACAWQKLLKWKHAEGPQAILRRRPSAFSYLQLLSPAGVARPGPRTRLVPPHLRRSPAALSLRGGGVRGDAGSNSFADQQTGAGHAIDRDAGREAALCAASAAKEEAQNGARRVVARARAAGVAAPVLRL